MSSNLGDQRNWLERLGDRIPGYSGYVDKERRRDIDKLHRDHLADRLRALKTPVNDVIRDLTSSGRLFEVGPIDRIMKKLDREENRIRFASYGYSGFFDAVKIQQTQLDAIYQFDLSLVEQVEGLAARITDLRAQMGSAEGLKTNAAVVETAVDELDRTFDRRYQAINGFGQEPKSLFT